jgi:hypothetical protein
VQHDGGKRFAAGNSSTSRLLCLGLRRERVRADTGAQWLQQRATSFQIVPAKYLSAAVGGITQQDMRSTWQDYIHQYL